MSLTFFFFLNVDPQPLDIGLCLIAVDKKFRSPVQIFEPAIITIDRKAALDAAADVVVALITTLRLTKRLAAKAASRYVASPVSR